MPNISVMLSGFGRNAVCSADIQGENSVSGEFPVTKTNKVRQLRDKASYDEQTVHQILDAGIVAHVAFVQDGDPVVVPMIYGRQDNIDDCVSFSFAVGPILSSFLT